MNIDWKIIADAIREQRFDDVPPETWNQVADKIDTNKRGRGRPSNSELGQESKLIRNLLKQIKIIARKAGMPEMTYSERCLWVEMQFKKLKDGGVKSFEAKEQIAEDNGWSVKTVEADLTLINRNRGFVEATHNSPFILVGLLSALDISFDEDGNLIDFPDCKVPTDL